MEIKRFVGGNLESNCYIISAKAAGECYVIDPGYAPAKIIKYIKEKGYAVKGILLTHHHHDHVGGAGKITDEFGCPVMMSFEDSFKYKGHVNIFLKDGDSLDLGGETLQIAVTPGHTAGSLCIVSDKSQTVFTGDTIFDTDLGRTDFSDGSDEAMRLSCRNVINKWPDAYRIYPGHDESATMKQVRKYNEEFLGCLEEK